MHNYPITLINTNFENEIISFLKENNYTYFIQYIDDIQTKLFHINHKYNSFKFIKPYSVFFKKYKYLQINDRDINDIKFIVSSLKIISKILGLESFSRAYDYKDSCIKVSYSDICTYFERSYKIKCDVNDLCKLLNINDEVDTGYRICYE